MQPSRSKGAQLSRSKGPRLSETWARPTRERGVRTCSCVIRYRLTSSPSRLKRLSPKPGSRKVVRIRTLFAVRAVPLWLPVERCRRFRISFPQGFTPRSLEPVVVGTAREFSFQRGPGITSPLGCSSHFCKSDSLAQPRPGHIATPQSRGPLGSLSARAVRSRKRHGVWEILSMDEPGSGTKGWLWPERAPVGRSWC